MHIDVLVADASHFVYADEICEEILLSARERGTGIARRTPEYLQEKMAAGKAVIALSENGEFAGFSYTFIIQQKTYKVKAFIMTFYVFFVIISLY